MAGEVRCAFDVMLCLPGVCVQPFPAPSKEALSCLAVPSLCVQAALYPKNLSLGNDLTLQTVFISFEFSPTPLEQDCHQSYVICSGFLDDRALTLLAEKKTDPAANHFSLEHP